MEYTKHAYKVLDATTGYYDALKQGETLQWRLKELRRLRDTQRITEKYYQEQVAPVKAEYKQLQDAARLAAVEGINAARDEYAKRVDDWAMPTPEKMHNDLKMLDGTIPLTKEHLEKLGEKHASNPVMVGAIRKYAADNNVGAYVVAPDASSKKTAFEGLCKAAVSAIHGEGGMREAAFSDKDSFERFAMSPALQDCGE